MPITDEPLSPQARRNLARSLGVQDIHESITLPRILQATKNQMTSHLGFCLSCGSENCEPDARDYPCESCGDNAVFGAAELLLRMS